MAADELRQLLRGSAFQPFTIHAEGKNFLISHPEFAALSPRGDTLFIFHKDDSAFEIVEVPLIARGQCMDQRTKPLELAFAGTASTSTRRFSCHEKGNTLPQHGSS